MTRLIDADALRDALGITGTKESCKGCQYNKRFNFACNTDDAPSFAYVCEAIDEAPTVDPVRHGKWIYTPTEQLGYRCSVCGKGCCRFNYCPACGARMDKE